MQLNSEPLTEIHLRQLLEGVKDPYTDQPIFLGADLKDFEIKDSGTVSIEIEMGYPIEGLDQASDLLNALKDGINNALKKGGANAVELTFRSRILSHMSQNRALKAIPGVKNLIAVGSGKGGVGKSTVALYLALAIQALGARVGLLDADIYGPSQPRMLGLSGQPVIENKKMLPLKNSALGALQVNSMGFLMEQVDAPMVWRGPMVAQALMQLAYETAWGDLDYLIVDLPPGTGDIQLTLAQKIPVTGAVIVTTPQEVALLDAKKAINMFKKLEIAVLGVVENMSYHQCSACHHKEFLFGEAGGLRMAKDYDLTLLGRLPLNPSVQAALDQGLPGDLGQPSHPFSALFQQLALKVTAAVALRPRNLSLGLPKVVLNDEVLKES